MIWKSGIERSDWTVSVFEIYINYVSDLGPSFLNLQNTDAWTMVSDFMIIGISL